MGDSAGNYLGVRGIGETTALKLLQKYGSTDQILQNIDQLTKGIQTKIQQNVNMLHLSKA
ncbi:MULTISPECIES: 5'-3' exonuclease H3TH domain-containing protein [Aeribacillus]|jgi:5'-3' exonuclease|uniref:5'-3' exonuclease domain-containing protein n=1 Tax=Aeribacillus pallidus TaxID=33936 RepID=A0A165XYL1_9BACI|nr:MULTISPECIES: 5'-3' exonuclease H3TH domain-containing protein [Aeribacillus]KZN96540.1 hypothetical protein AZI98_08170 [Aeribacillus pallidus]MED1441867.1 5'-3' exonuclease H3TH domain-containing protein [Aeribacillus composti]